MGEDRVARLMKALRVGRFQVMALLQAARFYLLTGDLDRAKSFGLNRAIFYAWAKHRPRTPKQRAKTAKASKAGVRGGESGGSRAVRDEVQVGPRGYFAIGGKEQTPLDFDRQVLRRIRPLVKPDEAWSAALKYVECFPRDVLEDPQLFFKYVYEPVRDTFLRELAEGRIPSIPPHVAEKLKTREATMKAAEEEEDHA